MNFTSQICTTHEQSERLLALGLKKETADMYYFWVGGNEYFLKVDVDNNPLKYNMDKTYIPAWSLHRLMEMIPSFIDIGEHTYMFRMIQGRLFSYRSDIAGDALLYSMGGVYNSAIYTIEWLIGEGCFNKEYLEK